MPGEGEPLFLGEKGIPLPPDPLPLLKRPYSGMELVSSAKLRARWAGTEVFFVLAGLLRYVRTGRRLQTAGAISVGFLPLYVAVIERLSLV